MNIKEEKESIIIWIQEQFKTAGKEKAIIAITDENSYVAVELLSKALNPKDVIAMYFGPAGTTPTFLNTLGVTSFWFQQSEIITEAIKKRLPAIATLDIQTPQYIKNIDKRVQMTALYGLANILGNALVIGSIDKTQDLNGDFVKYGNTSDIEILKSFYKSEVFEYLNELKILPSNISINNDIQTLETVFKIVLDGDEIPKDFPKEVFNNVLKQMRETEHKRVTPFFYGEMD